MLGDVGLMMALFVAKRIALKTKGATRNTREYYNLRLRSPCERKRLPKAAPNRQRADECPAGGSVLELKKAILGARPWPRRGPHCGPCFGPLMVYSFIGGPVWGPPGGARIFAPACFFSPSPRVAVRRFPPSLSSRPEMMARLPARLPLERRAQGPVICAGARAAPGRLRKLIDAKAKGSLYISVTEPTHALLGLVLIHHNRTDRMASVCIVSLRFLTYTLFHPKMFFHNTIAPSTTQFIFSSSSFLKTFPDHIVR